jgi:hypothetical protein
MYQEAIGCATSQKPTNNEATTRMSENTPPHSDEWHVPTQPFVERHQMGGCDTNMWPNEQGAWIVLALHACMLAMAACAMRIASVSVDELTCPSACRGCGTGHIRHAQLPEPKIHIERTAMATIPSGNQLACAGATSEWHMDSCWIVSTTGYACGISLVA